MSGKQGKVLAYILLPPIQRSVSLREAALVAREHFVAATSDILAAFAAASALRQIDRTILVALGRTQERSARAERMALALAARRTAAQVNVPIRIASARTIKLGFARAALVAVRFLLRRRTVMLARLLALADHRIFGHFGPRVLGRGFHAQVRQQLLRVFGSMLVAFAVDLLGQVR